MAWAVKAIMGIPARYFLDLENDSSRLEAAHFRHLHVHQDKIEALAF
jgi:hypothetical protein